MYQLHLTVTDRADRFHVHAYLVDLDHDGRATTLAESSRLTFVRTDQTSLDPFQAILEVGSDALRSMTDSGFRPRYCDYLF